MARLQWWRQNAALSGLIAFLFAVVSPLSTPAFGAPDGGILNFLGAEAPYSVEGLGNNDVVGAEFIVWWNQLEPEEGVYDWSEIDRFLNRWDDPEKLAVIRVSTAHEILNRTPDWLFDTYGVRRIFNGAWSNFEDGLDGYTLENGATRTNDPVWFLKIRPAIAGAIGERNLMMGECPSRCVELWNPLLIHFSVRRR